MPLKLKKAASRIFCVFTVETELQLAHRDWSDRHRQHTTQVKISPPTVIKGNTTTVCTESRILRAALIGSFAFRTVGLLNSPSIHIYFSSMGSSKDACLLRDRYEAYFTRIYSSIPWVNNPSLDSNEHFTEIFCG